MLIDILKDIPLDVFKTISENNIFFILYLLGSLSFLVVWIFGFSTKQYLTLIFFYVFLVLVFTLINQNIRDLKTEKNELANDVYFTINHFKEIEFYKKGKILLSKKEDGIFLTENHNKKSDSRIHLETKFECDTNDSYNKCIDSFITYYKKNQYNEVFKELKKEMYENN